MAGPTCESWGVPNAPCDCIYHCVGCRHYTTNECCSCCRPKKRPKSTKGETDR